MGMYTGFKAQVDVKPLYRPAIHYLHNISDEDWDAVGNNTWRAVWMKFPYDNFLKWSTFSRSCFIPFGCLAYMPKDFSNAENGESYSRFDEEEGIWQFCCSLKNYNNEIQNFVDLVLKEIVENVDYCYHLYEEYPMPDYGMFDKNAVDYDDEKWWMKWVTDYKPILERSS